MKTLQWLLTHSFSGKALAVKRVTENQGKRTPGVDRIIWKTLQAKLKAIESLTCRGYRPQPLRRVSDYAALPRRKTCAAQHDLIRRGIILVAALSIELNRFAVVRGRRSTR